MAKHTAHYSLEDFQSTSKVKAGCYPPLVVLCLVLGACALAGCQSRNVLRLSETTPDNGTFRLVYRTVGDGEARQGVEYIGPDWSLVVQSDAAIVSPAHEAAAAQLSQMMVSLSEAAVAVAKFLSVLP